MTFNEDSYTVAESDGQVSVSLRINGQFFVPMWAIVEIIDGTATGGFSKACTGDKRCVPHVAYSSSLCAHVLRKHHLKYT